MVTAKSRRKGQMQPQSEVRPKHSGSAKFVFYGDYLWPEEAKRQGGFLPPATTPPGPKYEVQLSDSAAGQEPKKVEVSWPTYLLATHQFFGAAAKQAADRASNETKGFADVVYVIHATPNMFNSGKIIVAVGGIRWTQVLGWVQVPDDYAVSHRNSVDKAELREHFEKAFREKSDLFQPSKDYGRKFDQYTSKNDGPQHLGSREELMRYMDKNGEAVGWRGAFPLFTPPKVITGEVSKAAKAKNAVSAPHESGVTRIWSFMKAHPVAIALLPAVIACNFIPGVGEAADAAELAVLSADAAEGIELTEVAATAEESSLLLSGASKLKAD